MTHKNTKSNEKRHHFFSHIEELFNIDSETIKAIIEHLAFVEE